MSKPNIHIYIKLLKDTYDVLKLLYDISSEAGCPYIESLDVSLDSLETFKNNVLRDLSELDSISSFS